ncbi:MAG: hypothetical protein NTY95_17780, partial [Bacteroidia bacterium]|nr:hypothetical protein [Bacteroidia bacterium]
MRAVPVSVHCEYPLGGAEHGASEITIEKRRCYFSNEKGSGNTETASSGSKTRVSFAGDYNFNHLS